MAPAGSLISTGRLFLAAGQVGVPPRAPDRALGHPRAQDATALLVARRPGLGEPGRGVLAGVRGGVGGGALGGVRLGFKERVFFDEGRNLVRKVRARLLGALRTASAGPCSLVELRILFAWAKEVREERRIERGSRGKGTVSVSVALHVDMHSRIWK